MVDCLIKATCAFSHSSGSSNPSLLFSAAHVAINGNGLLAFRAAASAPWRTFVKTSFEGMSSVHVPFFSASSFTASSHSRSTSPSACVFSYILPVCCACPAHATKLSWLCFSPSAACHAFRQRNHPWSRWPKRREVRCLYVHGGPMLPFNLCWVIVSKGNLSQDQHRDVPLYLREVECHPHSICFQQWRFHCNNPLQFVDLNFLTPCGQRLQHLTCYLLPAASRIVEFSEIQSCRILLSNNFAGVGWSMGRSTFIIFDIDIRIFNAIQ